MAPKPRSKPTSKPAPKPASASTATNPPPNWPALTPTLPPDLLTLTTILHSQIYTTPLLPSSLCSTYRHFLSTLPLLTTPSIPKRGDAVRVNDRYQVHDAHFAQTLFTTTGLSELLASGAVLDADGNPSAPLDSAVWGGRILGLSPNIRVYRYTPGQFFDRHYDEAGSVEFTDVRTGSVEKGRTSWTLLVYLSGPATGCVGGETVFYPEAGRGKRAEPVVVGLQVGMALLHRHGRECLLHEGREVVQGEKWVIRSDLVVAAKG